MGDNKLVRLLTYVTSLVNQELLPRQFRTRISWSTIGAFEERDCLAKLDRRSARQVICSLRLPRRVTDSRPGQVSKSGLSALESLQPYGTPIGARGEGMADLRGVLSIIPTRWNSSLAALS